MVIWSNVFREKEAVQQSFTFISLYLFPLSDLVIISKFSERALEW